MATVSDAQKAIDDLKTKFVGFDDQGNPVFSDNGTFSSMSKSDFPDLANQLQKEQPNKKFNDYYSDYQAKQITQGNKYLGEDNSGQSVFQNNQGIIERAKGEFQAGLKRQFGDKTFDKSNIGSANQTAGENTVRGPEQTRTPSGQFQLPKQNQTPRTFGIATDKSKPQLPPTQTPPPQLTGGVQSLNTQQSQAPKPTVANPVLPQTKPNMGQQLLNGAVNALGNEAATQVKTASQPYINQAVDTVKTAAQPYINQVTNKLGEVLPQGTIPGGMSTQDLLNIAKDPKAAAINYAANQTSDLIKNAMGDSQYAGDAAGLGASALSTALNGGDVGKALQQQALDMAKKEALKQGLNSAAGSALSSIPGGAGAVVAALPALTGGGSARDKGDAAAKAATMAAFSAATGGLGPSLLAAADLTGKLTSGIKDKNLAGVDATIGNSTRAASQVGNEVLNLAGKSGGDLFNSGNKTFQGAKDVLTNITKGNIGTALKGLGNTALQTMIDNVVKNPINLVKNFGSAVGNIGSAIGRGVSNVVKWVCFAPGTEILMKNGTTKKVEDIKIDDEVALGGKVMAIGTGKGTEFVVIKGVHVISTHALYEDGKWIRAEESKNITEKYHKEDGIVYPIVTERHLIVTDGQIWADTFEHDDQQDLTRDEIINKLNKDKHVNSIIDMYNKVKGWK